MTDQYISDVAWKEYEGQDVFSSVQEFVDAMPPATKAVHLLPADIGARVPNYRPLVAGDENLFGPYTKTLAVPQAERPDVKDESIWNVDQANHLLKDQQSTPRDQKKWEFHPRQEPYDQEAVGYPKGPGPFDSDYINNNYYREFTGREQEAAAAYMADFHPHTLSLGPPTKTAMVWNDIISGLSPKVVDASKSCRVKLQRAMPKTRRWSFGVTSESGRTHTVHIRAVPKTSAQSLVSSMDLHVGCSCEFWRWQGPDYHAHRHGYLDRKMRSDGSPPVVRDPENINRVCKHVYAASKSFLNFKILQRKKSSEQMDRIVRAQSKVATVVGHVTDEMRTRGASEGASHLSREGLAGVILALADRIDKHTRTEDASI